MLRSLLPKITLLLPLLVLYISSPQAATPDFTTPIKITDGQQNYHLSRLPNRQIALTSDGTLHIAYGAGSTFISPATPSLVFYQSWRISSQWSAPEQIANSLLTQPGPSQGQMIGGRYPALAITPNDTLHIAWQDYRNCQAGVSANYIDSIEIFIDQKPINASFSPNDFSLSTSAPDVFSDNAYLPVSAAHKTGRVSVCWYDFTAAGYISDIHLLTSDTNGTFPQTPNPAQRITRYEERGTAAAAAYSVPDIAVARDGNTKALDTVHLVWQSGNFGIGGDYYYAEVGLNDDRANEQKIATGSADFFDPAHIAVAHNGNVWIAYGDRANDIENITLLQRKAGAANFEPPIVIAPSQERQHSPDLAIDASGQLHLVWIDHTNGRHLRYALYSPENKQLLADRVIAPYDEEKGEWTHPAISLQDNGIGEPGIYILFEENLDFALDFAGDIWFAYKLKPSGAAGKWLLY